MGAMMIATLEVKFEMEDGHPDWFPQIVLRRQVAEFQRRIELGRGVERTGVKRGSTRIKILSQRTESGASPWTENC
jgi:hypothetical protein